MIPDGNPNGVLSVNFSVHRSAEEADGKLTAPLFSVMVQRLMKKLTAPHPSTDRALRRLTSEVRRDPVRSTRCGRQQEQDSCMLIQAEGPHKQASADLRNLDVVL